jgi:hypothetical protein
LGAAQQNYYDYQPGVWEHGVMQAYRP